MVGLTSTTLRNYTIAEVVDIAAEAGAEAIEWGSDVHVKSITDAELAAELCAQNGIKINSYGTYYRVGNHDNENWREICRISARLGAKSIRTWLGEKGSIDTDNDYYSRILGDARFMADIAAEYGLIISNECHPHTYNDTTESALRFLRDVKKDNVKTYYQSWYCDENGDKEKLFSTFPYVLDFHVSFSELVKFQGETYIDKDYINKISQWLRELGFNGCTLLEFTENGTAEEVCRDIGKLKELF